MKKFNLFLFAVMMPILFMVSCDSKPTVSNAAFRVQEVLEQKFLPNCKFDDGSIKGEEEYKDHFTVYQKFTADNKYGSAKNYIYKARLIYKGGDKYENSSWNIDYILVENVNTGEQWNISSNDDEIKFDKINNNPTNEKRQQAATQTKDGPIEGKDYRVIERKYPNYIYIYTPKRLGKPEIIKVYNIFKNSYESIRFTTSMNPNDDEYFCIQDPYVFDYSKKNAVDAMSKLKDFLKE